MDVRSELVQISDLLPAPRPQGGTHAYLAMIKPVGAIG
jgi:hypothetical protein